MDKHKFATYQDHDAINEAIYDAVCDGEGRANAKDLLHHLNKRGLFIIHAPDTRAIPMIQVPVEEAN